MKPKLVTINRLAAESGVDRRTISKRIKAAGLQPSKVDRYEHFNRREALEAIQPKIKPTSRLKQQRTYEQWRRLKLENDIKEGVLVRRDVVAEAITRYCKQADSALERRLADEFPSQVVGLDPQQARVYGGRLRDEVRGIMGEAFQEWAKPK